MSEALRLATEMLPSQKVVNTYIAAHPASGASWYDANTTTVPDRGLLNGAIGIWDTPEVYRNYPVTDKQCFADIDKAAGKLINFFLEDDKAFGLLVWEASQGLKP